MKKLLWIMPVIFCFSCSQPEQEVKMNNAEIEQFFQVFSSYIDCLDQAALDSIGRRELLDSILTVNDMERTKFDSTRFQLQANPEIFQRYFDQFDDSLRAERAVEIDN